MERVRGRLKKFRNRFEQKIDQLPLCFKPKKDMPKLIYTVMDTRECESLLCQNNVAGDFVHEKEKFTKGGRDRFLSDVSFWKHVDVSELHGGCVESGAHEQVWNSQHVDNEGPTIRLATFDVALFSLAPAIPPDHPAATAPALPDHIQQFTPAHYLSSESSVFSCKSKSTSSEASSGMTFFSNSRESNDSAETCAVLSHVSKPTQTFNVTNPCSLIGPLKISPVKQAPFDFRKAWRTTSLSAKTRAICHFKPNGGRGSINGPFYNSKLNPVFSLNSNSSKSLVDSLPRLFDQLSCLDSGRPIPPSLTISVADHVVSPPCCTPVGSPGKESSNSTLSSTTPLLLTNAISSDERCGESRRLTAPLDAGVVPSSASWPSTASTPAELSNSVSPQHNLVSGVTSAFTSEVASPASTNLSTKCVDPTLATDSRANQNLLSILDILLEVDADIIALQEVKAEEERGMKPLSELAEALGMEYAYAESWAPDFGNAVLSRWPIKSASVQQIHDETDYRNVLKVVVSVPLAGDLHFYCTQLDHLEEDWRMKQMDSLTSMVPPNQPHILTGNLNALNQADYSKERWEEIAEWRKKSNKAPPRGDLMKRLLQEKQYTDAKKFSPGPIAAGKSLQNKEETQVTCQHGTRVDYILGTQKLPFDFIPGSYSVVSSRGTSNHDLVMVDLQPHFHS